MAFLSMFGSPSICRSVCLSGLYLFILFLSIMDRSIRGLLSNHPTSQLSFSSDRALHAPQKSSQTQEVCSKFFFSLSLSSTSLGWKMRSLHAFLRVRLRGKEGKLSVMEVSFPHRSLLHLNTVVVMSSFGQVFRETQHRFFLLSFSLPLLFSAGERVSIDRFRLEKEGLEVTNRHLRNL